MNCSSRKSASEILGSNAVCDKLNRMTLLKGTRNKFIDSKGNCENVRLTWPGCFCLDTDINNKNCSTTVSSFRACWRNTFPTRIVCFCLTRRKASFLCHLFCTFPDCKNRWRSKGDLTALEEESTFFVMIDLVPNSPNFSL